jgi:hypothetical protein
MNRGFLAVAKQGVALHPCNPDKTPRLSGWQDKATNDPEQVEQWGDQFPDGFFGTPTGALNKFWVLDCDKAKDKYRFDREDELPPTLRQQTRSGGIHYFFKWNPERPVTNRTDVQPAVDVRGEGGYVIICPSEGYKFIKREDRNGIVFERDIAEAPEWVYEMVLKKKQTSGEHKTIDEEKLREFLFSLDPSNPKYVSREGWQEVMRAVHSASGGSEFGRQLFTEWSLQHHDPSWTKDVQSEIERDWNSYSSDKENATTIGTLVHHMREDGAILPALVEDTVHIEGEPKTIAKLDTFQDGRARSIASNLNQVLTCDMIGKNPNPLKDMFVYDEFAQKVVTFNAPPWDKEREVGSVIEDDDLTELGIHLSTRRLGDYSTDMLGKVTRAVAKRNKNHPVRNYLSGLEWDGTKRIETWLRDWCGVTDNAYTRAVAKKVLVAGVKRVFVPGCKFDNLMVLEGPQGCRKSTLIQTLAKDWYDAPHLSLSSLADGKADAVTNCFGSWIIEMEEMASVCQADEKILKKFLSTQQDTLTLKYDRLKSSYKRQFILIGTINLKGDGRYLRDITGGRRIWPINVRKTKRHPIDIEGFEMVVDQLWAEAYQWFRKDYPLHLNDEEETLAEKEQKDRTMMYQGVDVIESFILNNGFDKKGRLHSAEILQGIWGVNYSRTNAIAMNQCMENMGWQFKKSLKVDGKNRSGFIKLSETDEID